MHGNREIPGSPQSKHEGPHREVQGQKPVMNEHGKSDRPIVPKKSANPRGGPCGEEMEGRGLAKGNLRQQNTFRPLSRGDVHSALERVRQAA